ncbi:MAG TPA: cytochrome P450 [Acidimicrobiia bacterium]|nr:cytochrome P450 [Acidimicrobiia bacterium]
MNRTFELGAGVTRQTLEADLHGVLRQLREHEPVSWIPALHGWMVTRRDLAIEVLRDPDRFTVDDPRFSTGQVLGPSMLSLDGTEHLRHRDPFADSLRMGRVREHFTEIVDSEARRLVDAIAPAGTADLRRELAGPLAVAVVAAALDMTDVDPVLMRAWYDDIVAAVSEASDGVVGVSAPAAVELLERRVRQTIDQGGLLADARRTLSEAEVVSNTAVMLFGGVETSEGATANAFTHLLSHPDQLDLVLAHPDLLTRAVDESLRLEPSVCQLDRFATTDTVLGGVEIAAGDFVMVSVSAANRDPETYPDPDRFDVKRENARTHLAFAQGPHHCVGLHLARAETRAALAAAFTRLPGLRLTAQPELEGTVFRKPKTVPVAWVV